MKQIRNFVLKQENPKILDKLMQIISFLIAHMRYKYNIWGYMINRPCLYLLVIREF